MGNSKSRVRAYLRTTTGAIVIAALLAPSGLLAAGPQIEREVPAAIKTITAEELERLPQGRDFKSILDLHNGLRAQVNAPPLRWNPVLADHAQAYAKVMAESGQMIHSSRVGRENERENLSLSPHG